MLSLFLFIVLISPISSFGQNFEMQYKKDSTNEVLFNVTYTGPPAKITLPPRSRIARLAEHPNSHYNNNMIVVSNNPEEAENEATEYTISFSYYLILPDQSSIGNISDAWYPTIKGTLAEYSVTDPDNSSSMIIIPYKENNNGTIVFSAEKHGISLAVIKHSVEKASDSLPVTLFTSNILETPLALIPQIYNYLKEYFGDLSINEIIIVQNNLMDLDSFLYENKLYITLPTRGTVQQIQDILGHAWRTHKKNLSIRLFNMFKNTVLRLTHIDFENKNSENLAIKIEDDPAKIVLVPPKEYYETLLTKGFSNNEVLHVNVAEMINNYGLLHMAWYNNGVESVLNGIKTYFQENSTESTEENSNLPEMAYVNWDLITENKIPEPLLSLYTKEVLVENKMIPLLSANKNNISRNSFNIPDLTIRDNKDNTITINWNNIKTAHINIPPNGSYTLDPERKIPQQSFIESYYTFNISSQQERYKILGIAETYKAVGEQHLKRHLEIMEFKINNENGFDLPSGSKTFIVVSHVLSNIKGSLQDGIKESILAIQPDGYIRHVATRLRI